MMVEVGTAQRAHHLLWRVLLLETGIETPKNRNK